MSAPPVTRARLRWSPGRALLGGAAMAALIALPAWGAGGEQHLSGLRISLDPPPVSVEARGLPLSEVLAALGARAGFAVIGLGAAPVVERLAVQGQSVEDVVRQLLRGENHALLFRTPVTSAPYREIDTIVLLGRGQAASAAAMAEAGTGDGGAGSGPGAGEEAPWPEAGARLSSGPGQGTEPEVWRILETDGRTVQGLLRAHARSAPPAGPRGASGADPAALPAGQEEALAIATRAARESLRALVEGLATATGSLLQPEPPSSR